MVGLVTAVPALIVISEHKAAIFIFAGIMLSLSGFMQWRNRKMACPIDVDQAKACSALKKYSAVILAISLTAYFIGIFFAYLAKYL